MDIKEQILRLERQYNMTIPEDYKEFIGGIDFFDYSDTPINVGGVETEINHFLKEDDEYPSRDLFGWYILSWEETRDYLTIAMGYGNDEIAIKVKGENPGGIYYIDKSQDEISITKLFNDFKEFKNILKGEN